VDAGLGSKGVQEPALLVHATVDLERKERRAMDEEVSQLTALLKAAEQQNQQLGHEVRAFLASLSVHGTSLEEAPVYGHQIGYKCPIVCCQVDQLHPIC
jgi:hypothetical protein